MKQLLSSQNALDLQKKSEQLYLITEQALIQIIECRHQLRDFLRWILGTLPASKAHGVAMDLFKPKKIRKVRPSKGTVNHVASFLSTWQNVELGTLYGKKDIRASEEGEISKSEDTLCIAMWVSFSITSSNMRWVVLFLSAPL